MFAQGTVSAALLADVSTACGRATSWASEWEWDAGAGQRRGRPLRGGSVRGAAGAHKIPTYSTDTSGPFVGQLK